MANENGLVVLAVQDGSFGVFLPLDTAKMFAYYDSSFRPHK